MKKSIFITAFSIFNSFLFSQDLSGSWNGKLEVQGMELRIVFNVEEDESGFSSTMDSPDQGAKDIPVSKTEYRNDSVFFEMNNLMAKYSGRLISKDTIGGEFVQGLLKTNVTLVRGKRVTLNRPQEPKPPYPYTSENVTFENKTAEITLAGTLTKPEGEGPFACAVLISGSGPQNRDEELLGHKPFLVIADHFTRNGIAVLRYDDRGVAESTGDFNSATTKDFAEDVKSAVDFLNSRDDINQIGLIGHSEGGMIAPMVAAEHDDVDFIVLMAGPGVIGADVLLLQQELLSRAEGESEENIEINKKANKKIVALVIDTETHKEAKEKLKKHLKKSKNMPVSPQGMDEAQYREMLVNFYSTSWAYGFLKHSPEAFLTKVKCPVLAINGEKDLQVDANQNLPAIKAALEKGGNKDVTIKEYPNLNHLFQECETGAMSEYVKIEQTISPKVLDDIASWITIKTH